MAVESARLGLPLLAAGQAQKDLTHNEALALIDAGLCAAVEAMGVNAPPVSPQPGQCWILGSAPSGAWNGQADALAVWTESGWRFLPAVTGMQAWVKDRRLWAVRETGAWSLGVVRAEKILVADQQVVGERQASVAAPSAGGVVDAEARAAIDAIISRMVAHGLIEP